MQNIILADGSIVTLGDWQKHYGVPPGFVGHHSLVTELECKQGKDLLMNEYSIRLFDAFREAAAEPVPINCGYRTEAYQMKLTAEGFRTAKVSPHVQGMAMDIDTTSKAETEARVKLMETIAHSLGYQVRIGFRQYEAIGQTFFHVDVCPMFYAPSMPYHNKAHPIQWEGEVTW